jgi:RNA polymerase sigma-70 factor (ECF subfamily)
VYLYSGSELTQEQKEFQRKISTQNGVESDGIETDTLVIRARAGHRQALLELCRSIARGVLFRVLRLLPENQDAEDIAQDALIQVCENISALKEPKAFNGWLNSIVLNEVRKYIRKNTKRFGNVVYLDEFSDDMDIEEKDEKLLPLAYSLHEEECQELMKIIDALPERQRQAIVFHYYDGMSVTETARVMGIQHQNVSQYLMLARKAIKRILQKPTKQTGGESLAAIVPLSVAPLLSEAMRMEAGRIDPAWVQDAVDGCAEYIGASASVGVSAFAVIKAALLSKVAIGAAAVISTAIVTFSIWTPGGGTEPGTEAHPLSIPPEADPAVVYIGADPVYGHLNPQRAEAYTKNGQQFTPRSWIVIEIFSGETLCSGIGGVVEEPFGLLPGGMYRIIFTLEDEADRVYTLSRTFQIGFGPGI